MARYLAFIIAVVSSSLATNVFGQEPRFVTIKIDNKSATKFVAYQHDFLHPEKSFTPAGQNVVESKLQLTNNWFTYADIRISGKPRTDGGGEDIEHWVRVRIRRDSEPEFTIPVYFGYDRTNVEMDRLDDKRRGTIHQKWEALFRMYQIGSYYRGKHIDAFKRATRTAFSAAADIAEHPPYVILMSNEVLELVTEAFGNKSAAFLTRANIAKSAHWNAFRSLVEEYAAKNDCDTANLIFKAYEELKTREPEIFDASKSHPDVLKHVVANIAPRCGESTLPK